MTEDEELCAGFKVGRKEGQQKDVATTVFATRHKERIMNLIETSFNVPQTQSRTLRPTYMDKNGT
jgi:hypothetical protein